jgi:hypothetical protein
LDFPHPSRRPAALIDRPFVVESSYMPAGGSWQLPVEVSEVEIPGAAHPSLAVDARGDAIAVWDRGSAIDAVAEAASRPAGGSWGDPVAVSPDGDSAFEPQAALDEGGDALVLWSHFEGVHDGEYEYSVQSAFRPAGESWGSPVEVSEPDLSGHLHIAFDERGEATAIWDQWSHGFLSPSIVEAASRTPAGHWQAPVDLAEGEDETDEPSGAAAPTVAVDGRGDALAVWQWRFGEVVQASFRPAGGAWEAPVDISAFDGDAGPPEVAFDGAGDAIAGWATEPPAVGEEPMIQAALKPAGAPWQTPVDVSKQSRSSSDPSLAFDEAGDGVASWAEEGGIAAAGYTGNGPRLDGVSIPAEGEIGRPLAFSATPFDVWSVAGQASWSFGDGTAANGTSVDHGYAAPGTYEVEVQTTDLLGNVATASGEVTVSPAGAAAQPSLAPPAAPSAARAGPTAPLPSGGRVFTVHRGAAGRLSLRLVTSPDGRVIEGGGSATDDGSALSVGALRCSRPARSSGSRGSPSVTFRIPKTSLVLGHGAYGFDTRFVRRYATFPGSADKPFSLRLDLSGTVVGSDAISGTLSVGGGGCATARPLRFIARANPRLEVSPGE